MNQTIISKTEIGTTSIDFTINIDIDGEKNNSRAMLTQSSSGSKNIEVPQDFANLELDLKTILPSKEVQSIKDKHELMLKELHLKFNLELEVLSKSFFNDLNSLQ